MFCLIEFIRLYKIKIKPDETEEAKQKFSKTSYVPPSSLHSNKSQTFRPSSNSTSSVPYFASSAQFSTSTQSTSSPSSENPPSSDNQTSSETFVNNQSEAAVNEPTSSYRFAATNQTDQSFRASSSSSYSFVFPRTSRSSQKASASAPEPTRPSMTPNREQLEFVER